MPTSPEFSDVSGEIGESEVSQQLDAKEPSRSQRDVRITGEIAIDLNGKEKRAQNERATRIIG